MCPSLHLAASSNQLRRRPIRLTQEAAQGRHKKALTIADEPQIIGFLTKTALTQGSAPFGRLLDQVKESELAATRI